MEHPVRVAFCPILFAANGGQFDHLGRPIFQEGIRGNCDTGYDCGECPFMHQWVHARMLEGWLVSWECDQCVKDTAKTGRVIYGFFQSSRFRGPPDDRIDAEPEKSLEGCTRCGWGSSFLQLVLRRPG